MFHGRSYDAFISLLVLYSLLLTHAVAPVVVDSRTHECDRTPVSPKPQGAVCGSAGKLAHPQVLDTFVVFPKDALINCRDSCLDRGVECQSFSINAATGQCRLFGQNLAAMGFQSKPKGGNPKYYQKECFGSRCVTSEEFLLTNTTATDDGFYVILAPFQFEFYRHRYDVLFMNINGFVSFGGATPQTSSYMNSALPHFPSSADTSATAMPPVAILPYWDDLYVQGRLPGVDCPANELSYTVMYSAPLRTLKLTWKVVRLIDSAHEVIDIDLFIYENSPNLQIVCYNTVDGSGGSSATVGMQSQPEGEAGLFSQYSYNTASLSSRLCLEFNSGDGNGMIT